jgi:hypothetical protein
MSFGLAEVEFGDAHLGFAATRADDARGADRLRGRPKARRSVQAEGATAGEEGGAGEELSPIDARGLWGRMRRQNPFSKKGGFHRAIEARLAETVKPKSISRDEQKKRFQQKINKETKHGNDRGGDGNESRVSDAKQDEKRMAKKTSWRPGVKPSCISTSVPYRT